MYAIAHLHVKQLFVGQTVILCKAMWYKNLPHPTRFVYLRHLNIPSVQCDCLCK